MKQPKMSDVKFDRKGTEAMRKEMAQTTKVKITINFDAAVLEEVKKIAEKTSTPYQTLLNRIVKEALFSKKAQESRLDKLEKEVRALKKASGL